MSEELSIRDDGADVTVFVWQAAGGLPHISTIIY